MNLQKRHIKTVPREMTIEDIRQVQEAFASAAARAKEAGFEGVEIIGSAGYLITQFLSPLKNQRRDEYGGSFENRTRFPRELLKLVRSRLGKDFPLTIRMAGNDFVAGSNTDSETSKIAKVYEGYRIDAINVTGGWHESKVPQIPMKLPRTGYAFLARAIKEVVSVPVHLQNEVTVDLIKEKCPDHLIIAEGAEPLIPPIEGIDDPKVFTSWEVLRNDPLLGKNVAVVGGGSVGLETAAFIAAKGTLSPEMLPFLRIRPLAWIGSGNSFLKELQK